MMNPYYKVYIFVYLISRSILVNPECLLKVADKVVYEGCFVDSDTRLFPYVLGRFNIMTNDFCILACTDKEYAFAGTEATEWCFCGDDPYRDTTHFPKVQETGCTTVCAGDYSQICGGHWRLSIYHTGLKDPHKAVYEVLRNDVALLATPLETISMEINAIQCATLCSENDPCSVFSISTDSYQCQLYTYRNTCDGYTSTPNSILYARLLAP